MLIADDAGSLAGLQINKAHVQGNLVFFVQVIPYHIGKGVQIAFDANGLRFALKGRQRIAIGLVGMDEMTQTCTRCIVFKEKALVAMRIAVKALENRQLVSAVRLDNAGNARGVVRAVRLKLTGAQRFNIALACCQTITNRVGLDRRL